MFRCYLLFLVWNIQPVFPMYFSVQSGHFIWYIQLFLYLSVCGCRFVVFCTLLRVINSIVICVSLNSCCTEAAK
jgi:hypothetical protein